MENLNELNGNVNGNGSGNANVNGNGNHEGIGENNHNLNRRRTIREVTTSGIDLDHLVNIGPNMHHDFEIKGLLINSLPKFHGLPAEDPYQHLRELYLNCSSMKPVGASIEDVMWKVFHHSLEGKAKEWYMSLPRHVSNAFQSWQNLQKAFLEKYFPASRTSAMRKQINSILQDPDETLYEYWNRFQDLLARCPHHHIPDEQLAQTFYDGLKERDQDKIDAAAGGSIMDFTAPEAWELIKKMALAKQTYGDFNRTSRGVYHVNSSPLHIPPYDTLATQIGALITKLDRIASRPPLEDVNAVGKELVAPSCEYYGSSMHIASNCPSRY